MAAIFWGVFLALISFSSVATLSILMLSAVQTAKKERQVALGVSALALALSAAAAAAAVVGGIDGARARGRMWDEIFKLQHPEEEEEAAPKG